MAVVYVDVAIMQFSLLAGYLSLSTHLSVNRYVDQSVKFLWW